MSRSRSSGWRSRSRTEGCESLASRRCWTDSSSRRCSRFCRSSGTRRFPNTATVFERGGRPSRQWHRRSSISPKAAAGAWILIGRSFSIESTTTNRWERSPNGTGLVYKGLARLFRLLRNARAAETFGFVGRKACAMRFLATGEDRPQAVCGTGLAGRERGDGGENRLVPMRPVAREPEPGSGPSPVKCLSRLVWTSVIGRRPIA